MESQVVFKTSKIHVQPEGTSLVEVALTDKLDMELSIVLETLQSTYKPKEEVEQFAFPLLCGIYFSHLGVYPCL